VGRPRGSLSRERRLLVFKGKVLGLEWQKHRFMHGLLPWLRVLWVDFDVRLLAKGVIFLIHR
jgi:hypothetical protein